MGTGFVFSTAAQASAWTWAQTTALIVPVIALVGVYVTYSLNQRALRRERRSKTFAEALTAVEEYLEMPYRIRRRPSSPDIRRELTDEASSLLARMAFHHAWLQIEASAVAEPYAALVAAARSEAGVHMSEAWQQPPIDTDSGMNLGVAYPRDRSNAARTLCIQAMRRNL
ncbi:hypothetical protein [Streptomyces sp. TBY4]|uniref:hypothetical protein n=1 Tax=Streptomyces sp. TBY4 TaxID=2962030 RepID=UPI0020B73325|nr:hypothetical protein [Streptomyces sp. TBY4]MCP3753595.1 hypothetical protein [Streptomyces sp. TBY4]